MNLTTWRLSERASRKTRATKHSSDTAEMISDVALRLLLLLSDALLLHIAHCRKFPKSFWIRMSKFFQRSWFLAFCTQISFYKSRTTEQHTLAVININ